MKNQKGNTISPCPFPLKGMDFVIPLDPKMLPCIHNDSIEDVASSEKYLPIIAPMGDINNDYLAPLKITRHVFMKQYAKTNRLSCRVTNKYQIFNSSGDCIYFCIEDLSLASKLCSRSYFPFRLTFLTLSGAKVFEVIGQLGFRSRVVVQDPRTNVIGYVEELPKACTPGYTVRNFEGIELFSITGPEGSKCCCSWSHCGNVDFDVKLRDAKTPIGRISREWDYSMEELSGVQFPARLSPKTKVLLMSSLFLLDFDFIQGRRNGFLIGKCFLTFLMTFVFIGSIFLVIS